MTIAVVYVPPDHLDTVTAECLDRCAARGYVVTDVAADWPSALPAQAAGLVVVAGPDPIDPAAHASRYTNDQVREIIEGDGVAPAGLDPATIAAIRRIQRRLRGDRF
ncbi:hypothetical protein [Actinoplanes sp. NPDC049118]|uniref:hypothetical protein n=1 Tax=Actinoplanes sp. NPDC049118 TaxID=3155769 RepID=UPI003407F3F3